ncbi:hypothetical protein B795N_10330 [Marinilactibacillus psychrotolerans]|nr:hypothetical protein B795N_10330 [Marinilactibacillus psychrotolerans]
MYKILINSKMFISKILFKINNYPFITKMIAYTNVDVYIAVNFSLHNGKPIKLAIIYCVHH